VSSVPPRLRFAPSPTGYFHVGGARTALFNWLIAQRAGGAFVLRIEDTDTERNRDEWTQGIQDALKWIGVDWTEGPFFQSQRTELYANAVATLAAGGRVYHCDCTSDAVRARNIERLGEKFADAGYDNFCRDRGLPAGEGRATRFRTPESGHTIVVDLIRGEPAFDNALIDDFIIQRGNGSAMFLLANVVDDIDMRISHVIRGEEHLPNTPKAVLLWQALTDEVPLPVFAHLPVLVNEKRQKLSKRRDKVALEEYRDSGFLAEAMRNYLVLLGWSLSNDREIVSVQTMIDEFRLEDVTPSPAFFDVVKLTAFNAEYIRALSVDAFIEACRPFVSSAVLESPAFKAMAPMVQLRAKLLTEVEPMVAFLFTSEVVTDADAWQKTMVVGKGAVELLDGMLAYPADAPFAHDALKAHVETIGEANGLKLGKAQAPIRVAVTGTTVGLPLFEALEVLGRNETMRRVAAARTRLG
jgi:glutamyl-tRNA synthetase